MAVDGDASTGVTTLAQAQACTPKWRGAIWQEGRLTANVSTLMPQRWLATTEAAFSFVLALNGVDKDTTPGEVWCEYDLTFMYPQGN